MFQIIRIMTLFSVVFWGSCCSAAQRLDSALVGLNGYEEKKDPVECDYRTMEGKLPSQRNGRDSNVFGENNSEKDDSVFFKCILPLLAGVFGAFLSALIKAWIGERDAYRKTLLPRVQEISEHLDGLLSNSTVFMYKCEALVKNPKLMENDDSKISRQNVLNDVISYKNKLSEDRRSIRCLLWDSEDRVVEAMRRIEKVCGWITQFMTRPREGISVLEQADKVRKLLDRIFARSCRKGVWPSWWLCRRLAYETRILKQEFEKESDDLMVVGVDFLLPEKLVLKYKKRAGIALNEPIKGERAIKMYEYMLSALDRS